MELTIWNFPISVPAVKELVSPVLVNDVVGRGQQGAVQGDDISLLQKLLFRHVLHSKRPHLLALIDVISNHTVSYNSLPCTFNTTKLLAHVLYIFITSLSHLTVLCIAHTNNNGVQKTQPQPQPQLVACFKAFKYSGFFNATHTHFHVCIVNMRHKV